MPILGWDNRATLGTIPDLKIGEALDRGINAVFFDGDDLCQSAGVSIFRFILSVQERFDDLQRKFRSDDTTADAQHIHVIVFDALVSGIRVMTDCRADAFDLVRRNADTDSTAAHHDASVRFSVDDLASHLQSEIRVVATFQAVGPTVNQRRDATGKSLGQFRFQCESGVVAAQSDSKIF